QAHRIKPPIAGWYWEFPVSAPSPTSTRPSKTAPTTSATTMAICSFITIGTYLNQQHYLAQQKS
ncbi:hypothetical protein, partial [Pontibacter sp. 13R65]|uniref:hypothetical protein n=1 Tax=Pontibacter sp. 13R65 TaxID=3127458 RepID=UPI00301CD8C4